MFRISALLFIAVIGFQFVNVIGGDQNEVGAGDCLDFIDYDVNCPPGPGSVCENNKYDPLRSDLFCHNELESLNSVAVPDHSGNCNKYKDASGNWCPASLTLYGNHRNSVSDCTHIPCLSPF